jgi:hypothetical protein
VDIKTFLIVSLVIGISMLLAVGGVLLVRKSYPVRRLKELHEVAGNMLNVLATMYGLLMALIVVDAISTMQQARLVSELEANSLADIFKLAGGLPERPRLAIQNQCVRYAKTVIEKEWPDMARGGSSEEAWKELTSLWSIVKDIEPSTEQQKAFYGQMISELSSLGDNQRSRLIIARHGISSLLWAVLIVGAVVTMGNIYFFGVESLRVQVIMTSSVAIIIALNLFLIAEYGYPFAGNLRVKPEGLRLDLRRFSLQLGIKRSVPPVHRPNPLYSIPQN